MCNITYQKLPIVVLKIVEYLEPELQAFCRICEMDVDCAECQRSTLNDIYKIIQKETKRIFTNFMYEKCAKKKLW